jgi:hypothetical protein
VFSLCFVVGDKLVEYEVYEGLAPIILFFLSLAHREEVLGFGRLEVVLDYRGPEA